MQDILSSLTIGSTVRVSYFTSSGETVAQGVKKTLEGVVEKAPAFAKTTEQWVCTLRTEKGPRSFACQTVTALTVNGNSIR
jgi:hypothetical protein